ncbi:hypothetical protein LTR56_023971 [Elasticomyces elasticus]|nr:hypothetical protein LTR56_023971 [Elasticomyces elasticus]KAK3634638.1 hypothetical protein LTR22_019531 [Elasticomyces elasticus]KAK4911326.1 hypothetical protein LTR49_020063 [Elasticomyces elasticus]KAK5758209.1 hypothetical protein LTS12_011679 [Elasticomyces elasticus]
MATAGERLLKVPSMVPRKRAPADNGGDRCAKRGNTNDSDFNSTRRIRPQDDDRDRQLPSLLWALGERDIDFDDYVGNDVSSSEREAFLTSTPSRCVSRASSSRQTMDVSTLDIASTNDEIVCYGMLANLNCQRIRINTIVPPQLWLAEHKEHCVMLDHQLQTSRCILGVSVMPGLGLLNSKHCGIIRDLLRAASTRIQLYIPKDDLSRALVHSSRSKDQTFAVHANVYGPSSSSHWVGALLAEHGLSLQDPIWLESGLMCLNPHVVTFEGLADVDIWLQELSLRTDATGRSTTTVEWNAALDSLPQHSWSSDVNDSGVLDGKLATDTRLLPHQAAALDFMCKRESGRLDGAMKYWVESINEDGAVVYNHKITGVEREDLQPEPRSGILADDMGLGKTLTSIALILATLEEARCARKTSTASVEATVSNGITLIVVPNTMIMDSWAKEIERHTMLGTIRWSVYHGPNRIRDVSEALDRDMDVLITTYGTVTAEYCKPRKVLFHAKWFRLILDEAHVIRSHRTKQFDAVMALSAQHYWGLTGTPICNKIDDAGALVQFCRVPILEERKAFQKHLTQVAKKSFNNGCKVLCETLTPICLRRTKAILKLPEPRVIPQVVDLSAQERERYNNLMHHNRRLLDANTSGKLIGKARHTLLQVILQLQIFCDRGTFTPAVDMGSQNECEKPVSSKLNMLMDSLEQSRHTEKSIVFSAWRRTLDIASNLCTERNLAYARIDGTTPQIGRLQALDRFKSDATVSVLLMTLGTGAMGWVQAL